MNIQTIAEELEKKKHHKNPFTYSEFTLSDLSQTITKTDDCQEELFQLSLNVNLRNEIISQMQKTLLKDMEKVLTVKPTKKTNSASNHQQEPNTQHNQRSEILDKFKKRLQFFREKKDIIDEKTVDLFFGNRKSNLETVEKLYNRKNLIRNNTANLEKVFRSRLEHPFANENYHNSLYIFQLTNMDFENDEDNVVEATDNIISKNAFEQIFSTFKFIRTPEDLQEYFEVEELEDSIQTFSTVTPATNEDSIMQDVHEVVLQDQDELMPDFGGFEENNPDEVREEHETEQNLTDGIASSVQIDHEASFRLKSLFFDSKETPLISTRKVKTDLNQLRECNQIGPTLKYTEENLAIQKVEREIEDFFDDIPLGGFDMPLEAENTSNIEPTFDPFETISEDVVKANKEKEISNLRKRKRLEYIQSLLESSNQAARINLTITKISTIIQKYLMTCEKMRFEDLNRLLSKELCMEKTLVPITPQRLFVALLQTVHSHNITSTSSQILVKVESDASIQIVKTYEIEKKKQFLQRYSDKCSKRSEYEICEKLAELFNDTKIKEDKRHIHNLKKAQTEEKKTTEENFEKEKENLKKYWVYRFQSFDKQCKEHIHIVKLKHKNEVKQLLDSRNIEFEKPVKFSTHLLQLKKIHEQLVRQKYFTEAIQLQKQCEEMEKQETKDFRDHQKWQLDKKLEFLHEKHRVEMESIEMKFQRDRKEMEKEQQKDGIRLEKQIRNTKLTLEHSHNIVQVKTLNSLVKYSYNDNATLPGTLRSSMNLVSSPRNASPQRLFASSFVTPRLHLVSQQQQKLDLK